MSECNFCVVYYFHAMFFPSFSIVIEDYKINVTQQCVFYYFLCVHTQKGVLPNFVFILPKKLQILRYNTLRATYYKRRNRNFHV